MSPEATGLAQLDELQAESAARRRELLAIAAEVPHALSRRQLVVDAARELRHAPNKGEIARRGLAKLARLPMSVARRVRRRLR